jgi:hypothetical protein
VTFLPIAADGSRYRVALPVSVYDAPDPLSPGRFQWSYSGEHLLEISGIGSAAPRLDFHGVLRTATAGGNPGYSPFVRGILHDDSVFVVDGAKIFSSLWGNVTE